MSEAVPLRLEMKVETGSQDEIECLGTSSSGAKGWNTDASQLQGVARESN